MTEAAQPATPAAEAAPAAAPAPAPAPTNELPQPDPALMNPDNEVRASFVKWGKVGDWFEGTLHDIREVPSQLPGQEGTMQKIYEFTVRNGYFHDKKVVTNDAGEEVVKYEVTVLQKGEMWSLGGNKAIDDQMRRVKIGQIFGIRFTETKPSKKKGFADQKVRKVYPGKMDPEFTAAAETGAGVPVEDIDF